MELREKIAAIIVEALGDHGIDYGNVKGELAYAEDILAIPEIAEALRELALRKRVEERLAGTMDERPFIDGTPLGPPNA